MLNGLEGHGDRVQVIRKCLDLTFGDIETTAENMHARPQSPVIALDTAIKGGIPKTATNSTAGQATGEPRLLRNLLLIALSARLPDECWEHLLTPLSELRIEAIHSDEMAAEAAPLSIDEVRRIAAQLPDTGSGAADQQIAVLERALRSIDLLVSAKEKEVAKRRDEIDTYNQVIQTLVAQASKLH
ncbi:hypothetical protein GQ54DRAFT_312686 [Martensiomyces pterosporus]|nr:hypothetical protein GQ54DRAFT_312686 [Martensiomyces pterosporus]